MPISYKAEALAEFGARTAPRLHEFMVGKTTGSEEDKEVEALKELNIWYWNECNQAAGEAAELPDDGTPPLRPTDFETAVHEAMWEIDKGKTLAHYGTPTHEDDWHSLGWTLVLTLLWVVEVATDRREKSYGKLRSMRYTLAMEHESPLWLTRFQACYIVNLKAKSNLVGPMDF